VDALSALGRIQEVFEAESLPDEQIEHAELDNAVELDNVSFTWDAPPPEPGKGKDKAKDKDKDKEGGEVKSEVPTDVAPAPAPDSVPDSSRVSTSQDRGKTEKVFKIQRTNLTIPKGQVVAIVGQVGSGKSSFLQGLIGEMRRETGSVKFCGSVSYCPQNAWIQVFPLTSRSVMLCLTKRIAERHHPRERLLRSPVRF